MSRTALIKSNNPHLAGGEKCNQEASSWLQFPVHVLPPKSCHQSLLLCTLHSKPSKSGASKVKKMDCLQHVFDRLVATQGRCAAFSEANPSSQLCSRQSQASSRVGSLRLFSLVLLLPLESFRQLLLT